MTHEKAPSFSLIEYGTNREVSLDEFRGRVVLLTFWVSWCPDCHRDLPKKEKLYEAMKTKDDFVFLSINVTAREGDADDGIRFIEQHDYSFPVLRDKEQATYDAYQCTSVPYTILLNRKHEMVERFDDRSSFIEMALALETLMEQDQES